MNNKIVIFALVASFCVFIASAIPVVKEDEFSQEPGLRQKRVSCDLLSASVKGVKLNHSACAAHCLVQRYKGGYCQNGVCHCRK
ncbi:hypothetical protein ILUMI_25345 [Ignelater luminosus]|uniref:Invertebrate defensins family profile domain-containing protein n=1 Tax=Ignelater luminosus TaxID=2038154 RepID=A0A8K0FZR9_IGNLU|nr:hypothetical protein ILUMI_25345 [Ignelater luminosus]